MDLWLSFSRKRVSRIIWKTTSIRLSNRRRSYEILKTQQRFKFERHVFSTEEINEIALHSNDDKRMQSIHSVETYVYETSKDLVSEKEDN